MMMSAENHMIDMGEHNRVKIYTGSPNYDDIISKEFSGELIKRVTNTAEEKGRRLILGTMHDTVHAYLLNTM
jgi:hypothetical protein